MKKIIRAINIIIVTFILINIININISFAETGYRKPSNGGNFTMPVPQENQTKQEYMNSFREENGKKQDSDKTTSSGSAGINPDDYKPSDPTKDDAVEVVAKIGIVLGFIRNMSAIVSVIVLMIIGFKYMIGSVEQKANYKATMMPYIIGCIMAVSGTTIVSFIYNIVH